MGGDSDSCELSFSFNATAALDRLASVTGVRVAVTRFCSDENGGPKDACSDLQMQLRTGLRAYEDKAVLETQWGAAETTAVYGGQGDLWAAGSSSLDVAALRDPSFRFVVRTTKLDKGSYQSHIDCVELALFGVLATASPTPMPSVLPTAQPTVMTSSPTAFPSFAPTPAFVVMGTNAPTLPPSNWVPGTTAPSSDGSTVTSAAGAVVPGTAAASVVPFVAGGVSGFIILLLLLLLLVVALRKRRRRRSRRHAPSETTMASVSPSSSSSGGRNRTRSRGGATRSRRQSRHAPSAPYASVSPAIANYSTVFPDGPADLDHYEQVDEPLSAPQYSALPQKQQKPKKIVEYSQLAPEVPIINYSSLP